MKFLAALLLSIVSAFAQTPTVTAVANVASFQVSLCPGVDAAIYGTNFGTSTASVSVSVGGVLGSVLAVSPNQINAQLPVNVAAGQTSLTVAVNGISSAPFNITLAAYAPAMLTQSGTGTGAGLIRTAGGANVTTANPAHPSDTLSAYLVGLGPTNPPTATGATTVANRTATTPVLMVGTASANIIYAGTGGGGAGLYQINFQVPAAATGVEPVVVKIGGFSSPPVTLALVGASPPATGLIDTPPDNSTNITGAVGFTGWAVSWAGVQTIALWREPVTGETPTSNGLVFIENTAIVPGSRPDVAAAYPGYPGNSSGYGAQVLTNELPNSTGAPGVGNGTYKIHALVTDNGGEVTDIGKRTITVDNAQGKLPFGTIDTPAVGATASGAAYVNFGWAVTPNASNVIPKDGSTIVVYIDNQPVGHPVYNQYRPDIATLFPGLQNSNGAVGYYMIDTTKLTNGLHSIAWSVTDNAGNAQGIGSRFFIVQN